MKNSANARLEALMRRKADLAAALRAEREKQKEIERKDDERLIRIVGRALLAHASQHPDFDLVLRGVLRVAVTSGSAEYNYLRNKRWLP